MTDRRDITPEERGALAAEFALGLLEGEELVHARLLLSADPAFRDEAARWSGRLAPLLDEIQHAQPPERLWRQISDGLGEQSRPTGELYQLRQKVRVWRGISGAAMAIAASFALFLVVEPRTAAPPVPVESQAAAPLVAMIGSDEEPAAMMATWDSANRRLMVAAATPTPAAPGRSHELWVIPSDGTPRSLGTMPTTPRIRMAVDQQMARQLHEGATLAVSDEPQGGSPTGLPTGPVIASGKLERA